MQQVGFTIPVVVAGRGSPRVVRCQGAGEGLKEVGREFGFRNDRNMGFFLSFWAAEMFLRTLTILQF